MPGRMRGFYRKSGFYGRYNRYKNSVQELKFLDRAIPLDVLLNDTLTDTGTDILRIPQNTTESGRIGRKVIIKSIQLRIHLLLAQGSTPEHDQVRFILVHDKQCNGAVPSESQILATGGNVGSFYQLENQGRFTYLWDQTFALYSRAGAGNGSTNLFGEQNIWIKKYIKLHMPIEYNSTVGAVTEIKSNNLILMAMSTHQKAGLGNDCLCRVRYMG